MGEPKDDADAGHARTLFAAAALMGLLAHEGAKEYGDQYPHLNDYHMTLTAERAAAYADALVARLKGGAACST